MPGEIDRLYALQQADLTLRSLRVELDELERAAGAIRAEMAEKRASADIRRQEMAAIERRRREIETTLKDEEEKTRVRRMRMQRIRNDRELLAIRREIEVAKEGAGLLEDELIRLMENGEAKAAELEGLEKELAEREEALQERERQLADRNAALKDDLDRAKANRSGIVSEIDETVLRRYEMLAARKNGLAVVQVRDGGCGGCGMRLQPQIVTQLHRGTMMVCQSCGRMLALPPPTPPVDAAAAKPKPT